MAADVKEITIIAMMDTIADFLEVHINVIFEYKNPIRKRKLRRSAVR